MPQEDSEFWARARRARDKLVDQFVNHPDVSLIDIGHAPERGEETEEVVLRIHVRERWVKAKPDERVAFPEQVDGIPVVVILGEYQLETDASAASEGSNHPDSTARRTGMGTEENAAALAHDERERSVLSMMRIKGIARKTAEALYEIGIRSCTDMIQYLTQHTDQELLQALHEQGVRVLPQAIGRWDWIGQARELAGQENTERTPSEEEAEVAKEPEEAPSPPTWRQQAGFSLFFDYVTDEHGEQVWQTRAYHDESGEETLVPGIETAQWVNWVLERANLPVAAEPIPTEIEAAVPAAPATPYDAQVEILDTQVSVVPTPAGVREKKLMAEVRFQISGVEAEKLTAERVPFQIGVHTVDVESEAAHLVASERSRLQPQVFEYISQQEFPLPDLGRYELQSIVLLLPPGEMMAFHQGAPFRVVP